MSTTEPTIPGTATLVPDVSQWRIETIQLINWGGFQGHHEVDVANLNSVLLTGASGTGKSTLWDSNIALMMDSNTPFNGASNDNTTGRARSAEQRNVLSYVRGKIDTQTDPQSGKARDRVLRGENANTWSAIATTWVNDDGTSLTAMRLYYAPASAVHSRDVKVHMAIYPGRFDLREVEEFARSTPAFHHSKMTGRFPGLTFHDSYGKFSAALHKRLGIGKHGDGAAAMKLLARVQGGRQVASVDGLYKDMVLERPRTYDAADRAIGHFDLLEASYETMRTAQLQIEALSPISGAHAALRAAEAEVDLIDTYRVTEPVDAPTPLALWAARTEADLIEAEITANRSEHAATTETRDAAAKRVADLERDLAGNQRQQRENGGDALAQIDADLAALRLTLDQAVKRRTVFTDRTAPLACPEPATEVEHQQMRAAAAEFLTRYAAAAADLDERVKEHTRAGVPLWQEREDLRAEAAWLGKRSNLIPEPLDRARRQIADAVGLKPSDLPFVAELIDLHPDHEAWRAAAELLLGGFGRNLLVDARVEKQFRVRINALGLKNRVRFDFVPLGQEHRTIDEAILPGRLIFAEDSPFTGWLQAHLQDRFGYECITDPSGFKPDRGRRIALSGQIQNGTSGAHGGGGRAHHILGFSNTARLADIADRLTAIDEQMAQAAKVDAALAAERRALDAARAAHQHVADTTWDAIDVTSARAAVTAKEDEQAALLAASDTLAALKDQERVIQTHLGAARRAQITAENTLTALDTAWDALVTRKDAVVTAQDAMEGRVTVTDAQADRLAEEYTRARVEGTSKEFPAVLTKIRRSLTDQVRAAGKDVETHTAALTAAFTAFYRQWPQPNLGTGVDSYPGYHAILQDLLAEGLAERKDAFTQKVIDWSGQDLLGVHRAFAEAIEEIEYRLVPVNEILARLPFGPGRDRLQIRMRTLTASDITLFKAELKTLASHTTLLVADEVESRFKQLRKFMRRMRPTDQGGTGERDHLLDVRRHVHIDAERQDAATGEHLGLFDTLGGKSGGETQELIAFIVGAALRYQLGNEHQPRPIYAPVFLDEGFVKADSEFAGRAVDAWRGLGFQLLIGAPLDKVTAIEPYMDRIVYVTKSADGYSDLWPVEPAETALPVPSGR